MTIEEAIISAKEGAEKQRKVIETHIVFGDVTLDEMYADDTEIIEENLKICEERAKEYEQLVEWLEELKTLKSINWKEKKAFADKIISLLCVEDEDYDKPVISPKFLKDCIEQMLVD